MFQINPTNKIPLYQQVKDMLIKYIVQGVFQPQEAIPSIRDLANQLAINPNTVLKAFKELESEGYIYSIVGKGSYVSDIAIITELNKKQARYKFTEQVKNSLQFGLSPQELMKMIKELSHDQD